MALSLPPDQQKRTGVDMVIRTFERIAWERWVQHAALLQRRRSATSTLCFAEMGRSGALVLAAEAIVHADAHVAAESRKANGVQILLVKEVGGARVERNAASDDIATRNVETRITRIARQPEAIEVAVSADSREI